jgi:formate--tetrahydrofolate ligase
MATTTALKLADYVVTEAGFGADLGAEKFFDIKCRKAGLKPSAVVIVATVRALKSHGGVTKKEDFGKENVAAVEKGFANLQRHIENVSQFGVPAVVAINRFITDTDAELAAISKACKALGSEAIECTHWSDGSKGTRKLANKVVQLVESGAAKFKPLYPDNMKLVDKIRTIAQKLYRADDIAADKKILSQLADYEAAGYGKYPVCIAKTQYSFSSDPNLKGAPTNHVLPVREVRLSAGAEFLVVVCGEIMTMPGLPRVPAANNIGVDKNGDIFGLF